jgi:CheY-like chemotaxis protein
MQIGVETSRAVENKRIFVVDDDDITRAVLQFMLQDENETHDLPSLADAYRKGEQAAPDLILLGTSVIARDGPGVLAAIATRWSDVRILVVAERGEEISDRIPLQGAAHGVVNKPLTLEAVRRKVDIQFGRIKPPLVQLQLIPAGAR